MARCCLYWKNMKFYVVIKKRASNHPHDKLFIEIKSEKNTIFLLISSFVDFSQFLRMLHISIRWLCLATCRLSVSWNNSNDKKKISFLAQLSCLYIIFFCACHALLPAFNFIDFQSFISFSFFYVEPTFLSALSVAPVCATLISIENFNRRED